MGVALLQRLAGEEWLLLEERSNTGKLLRAWLAGRGAGIRPAMEADTFDLIVNLGSMGMGCSIVPSRSTPRRAPCGGRCSGPGSLENSWS